MAKIPKNVTLSSANDEEVRKVMEQLGIDNYSEALRLLVSLGSQSMPPPKNNKPKDAEK